MTRYREPLGYLLLLGSIVAGALLAWDAYDCRKAGGMLVLTVTSWVECVDEAVIVAR